MSEDDDVELTDEEEEAMVRQLSAERWLSMVSEYQAICTSEEALERWAEHFVNDEVKRWRKRKNSKK